MNRFDKVVIYLMGFYVVSAILTLVSYLLFELFGIGPSYLPVIFFYCAMLSALMFNVYVYWSNDFEKTL